ncbi:MAG: general secretion pathway protein E, partial [Oleiphilaceae bacterium]
MLPQPSQTEALNLIQIVWQLEKDNLISAQDTRALLQTPKGKKQANQHPLETIADAKLKQPSGQALSINNLLSWFANWAKQSVFQIDPLKIDGHKIAGIMSFAFAQRHQILAVEIHQNEVVIASAQPFVSQWEEDLKHTLKKNIHRVVVNPTDLRKFTIEFYELANSINKAGNQTEGQAYTQNFEQMLELGKNQSNPDADDQHIINIVDWLLQYAFDQRASDIHIEPRRDIAQVRFRIDGVLHNVYEFPAKVGLAVTSRLKILGRLNVA